MYGQNVDDLVKYQMDTFGYSEDVAREEVVANSAATVLTDEEFVRNLYNNEHSLFEQIRKFFKELADTFKQLTQSASWSQDAALTPENVRAIAEVFDRVAADTSGYEAQSNRLRYAIKYDADNRPYVVIEEDILKGVPKDEWLKTVRNAIRSRYSDGIVVGNRVVQVSRKTANEMTYSQYAKYLRLNNPDVFEAKLRATNNIDEVLVASRDYVNEKPAHARNDGIQQFARGNVLLRIGKSDYEADVIVATRIDNTLLLYDMLDFGKSEINGKKKMQQSAQSSKDDIGRSVASSTDNSVAEASDVVNFSAKDPVEEKGTLLAIHNLTEEMLQKFLALGGAPMPSIAVTRSDVEHSNFGNISLIFDKSTIDPKASRKNTVYSADAWTPTFPRIEYETNTKVDNAVYSRLTALSRNMDEFYREDLKRVLYGVDDGLNRYGGEAGFVERAMDNLGLQTATKRKKHSEISECFPFFVFSPRAP